MKITDNGHYIFTTISVTDVSLSQFCTSIYMLYLKIHNGYRDVLGTNISAVPNFIFNFNMFMVFKIEAFRVMKEKPHFWADILDFGAAILEFFVGPTKN